MGVLRGKTLLSNCFSLHSEKGVCDKFESLESKFYPFRVESFSVTCLVCGKANRKSLKLSHLSGSALSYRTYPTNDTQEEDNANFDGYSHLQRDDLDPVVQN